MKRTKIRSALRKTILKRFSKESQAYKIFDIVTKNKSVPSSDIIETIANDSINISHIIRSRINPTLKEHKLAIFSERLHGTKQHSWTLYDLGGATQCQLIQKFSKKQS